MSQRLNVRTTTKESITMTLRIIGLSAFMLGLLAVTQPSFATEPGSKECVQYSAANNCTAHWDRRDKSCKC
jgi:hypothetical protein